MSTKDEIRAIIDAHDDDEELAGALLQFSRSNWTVVQELGWWGPLLYRRNRRAFVSLIEQWVSPWALRGAKDLDVWMDEAERNGDLGLWRGLYQAWLSETFGWSGAAKQWQADLLEAFRTSPDRGARRDALEKYDIWYEIEDDFAAELYDADPLLTRELVVGRIERSGWWDLWYEQTAKRARERGDEAFYFELYRLTFPPEVWAKDVLALAGTVKDPGELHRELERRHPSGPARVFKVGTLEELLRRRGADVVPYLLRRVPDMRTWGLDKEWRALAKLARELGFDALWATVVRSQFHDSDFSKEVERLCKEAGPEWNRAARLVQIVGTKWGWGAWRHFVTLEEKAALRLYEAFPQLCRTAFAVHFRPTLEQPYLDVAKRAAAAGDWAMVDLLASKVALLNPRWGRTNMPNLNWYAEHYAGLDGAEFARRAFDVLNQMESGERGGPGLRRDNAVYRVFFDDPDRYASMLANVRDLLEAPLEDVRRLGMDIIISAGSAGLGAAVANVDHLRAYLLDESSRATRIAAFEALAVASFSSRELATEVLGCARAALDLRRKRYPRDRVIALVGHILHQWPELRGAREQPVVFGAEAAW